MIRSSRGSTVGRLVVALAGAAAACGEADPTPAPSPGMTQPVRVRFEATLGGAPFACTRAVQPVGTTTTTGRPLDLRLYVHDVRLVRADATEAPVTLEQDGAWQYQDVALLDFEDATGTCSNGTPETHTEVSGTVAAGTYVGLRFRVGVPFALNHVNPAELPPPLDVSTLFWSWQGGFKFIRFELATNGLPRGFALHLGSTGCDGTDMGGVTTCAQPNRPELVLPAFDASTQRVRLDMSALLSRSNLDVSTGAPGCMSGVSDPECWVLLPALGLALGERPADPLAWVTAVP
jgi:uncharacterized repeat protein (TIGR04052 family)